MPLFIDKHHVSDECTQQRAGDQRSRNLITLIWSLLLLRFSMALVASCANRS